MRDTFDRRVVKTSVLDFIRVCQERVPCHLGGGAALSGAYLGHRMTGDCDLFVHDVDEMRELVRVLPEAAAKVGASITIQRNAGHIVRASFESSDGATELDVVHERVADLESPPPSLEGIIVESLTDLRANKLTCILSRSEPRDLVDLCFLDRAGHAPEEDLELAIRKDGGVDPGILAWLLSQFPVEPLPQMLEPFSTNELQQFRDDLAERMRRISIG